MARFVASEAEEACLLLFEIVERFTMMLSSLRELASPIPFLAHPVFERSLAWIRAEAENAVLGKYELGEPGWTVSVDAYSTKLAQECQWENHTQTIDLHYLMEGAEGIGIVSVEVLGAPSLYREASDTQKFTSKPDAFSLVVLRPGNFVILMPGEAHCPKIAIGDPAPLRKLVCKIPQHLFG